MYKIIVIGASTGDKSTLMRYLRQHTDLVVAEMDEEIVKLNGNKWPTDDDYRNTVLVPKITKEIIDKEAKRYFVVFNPKKIKIKYFKKRKVKIPLHPDRKIGSRELACNDEFYVQDELKKGVLYRFMHLFNFVDGNFVNDELDKNAKLIHWLPASKDLANVKVIMDDNSVMKGFGEKDLRKVKVDEIIQRCH